MSRELPLLAGRPPTRPAVCERERNGVVLPDR